jgi:hypothetical protein
MDLFRHQLIADIVDNVQDHVCGVIFSVAYSLFVCALLTMIVTGSSATEASTMLRDSHEGRSIYRTVVRAIIESSLITWVVLLVYSISNTIFYALNEMGAYNVSPQR